MGKGGSGGGGGGSSGEVKYPDYMEQQHRIWLQDIDSLINTMSCNNPYDSAESFDPSEDLTTYDEFFEYIQDKIERLNINTEQLRAFSAAKTMLESSGIYGDDYIDDMVSAFADRLRRNMYKTMSAYKAGMSEMNAVVGSSAFIIGRGLIEAQLATEIAAYQAEIEKISKTRMQEDMKIYTDQIFRLSELRMDSWHKLMMQYGEKVKLRIAAMGAKYDKDLEIDTQGAMFTVSLYQYAANMMSSIAGSAISAKEKHDSKTNWLQIVGGTLGGLGAMLALI